MQHATISAKKKAKKPKTKTQKGKFSGGVFKVTQARSGLATLALVEGAKFKGAPTFASCKTKKGKAVTAALIREDAAVAALGAPTASSAPRAGTRRRPSAARSGRSPTAATARSTHAIKDTVTVSDFVRHKTIILRAGTQLSGPRQTEEAQIATSD